MASPLASLFFTEKPNILPDFIVHKINCSRIFNGDDKYTSYVVKIQELENTSVLPDYYVFKNAINCQVYRTDYVTFIPSIEEVDFPLAFQILTFKDAVQFEYLLKAIYRPHNEYCIHTDKKVNEYFSSGS